jgi:catechol 2,3-dioxygenase-like lactoylglutathione lyase family enzyme
MRITEIAFSCYPVTDVARARAFYEGVLGLTPAMNHETPNGHWIEYEIGSGTLSLGSAPGWNPSPEGCSVALEVENFDQAIAELRAAETPFQFGPIETPVCHMAFVKDPDGNAICIHHRKPGHG